MPRTRPQTIPQDSCSNRAHLVRSLDYYNLLREFIALLKDSHTDVGLPGSLWAKYEVRPSIPLAKIGNEVVVWLDPSPEVQRLGFRKGNVIRRIDGIDAIEWTRTKAS